MNGSLPLSRVERLSKAMITLGPRILAAAEVSKLQIKLSFTEDSITEMTLLAAIIVAALFGNADLIHCAVVINAASTFGCAFQLVLLRPSLIHRLAELLHPRREPGVDLGSINPIPFENILCEEALDGLEGHSNDLRLVKVLSSPFWKVI